VGVTRERDEPAAGRVSLAGEAQAQAESGLQDAINKLLKPGLGLGE
jgi:hypothetical protein